MIRRPDSSAPSSTRVPVSAIATAQPVTTASMPVELGRGPRSGWSTTWPSCATQAGRPIGVTTVRASAAKSTDRTAVPIDASSSAQRVTWAR